MSTRAERRPAGRARRGAWVAGCALLILAGTVASLLGAFAVQHNDAARDRLGFHLAAEEITSTLKLAIQHEEDLVITASAFVANDPELNPARFDSWMESVHAMRRYPELENIGFVVRVPAASLAGFRARIAREPLKPFGLTAPRPRGGFAVLPPGARPYYCFALAGLARSPASYLPAGLDYCAFAGALEHARESGQASYAPFSSGGEHTLGVQTPVYRGGPAPGTPAARRRAFAGWLGELLDPHVLLARALQGHPHTAVTFHYRAAGSDIVFRSGSAPRGALVVSIDLHNGWTVRTAAAAPPGGVTADGRALTLLLGGMLLSTLLGLLVLALGTGRMRALSLVREKTRELSHLALHDGLTGLANRALVLDRAEQLLARTARQPGLTAGALFLDVDGFKHVNDSLGHAAGDRLLSVIADRLRVAVREQDTVGRLGGDEFVVLVESAAGESTADALADRLVAAVRKPIELEPGVAPFTVTASIGVAVGQYPSSDALLRDADLALYAAKAAGRDRYSLFDAGMGGGDDGRATLERDLATAVQAGQLFLLYQPVFNLAEGQLEGAEALLRWRHPVRGILAPDEFIALAEETGLIVPIGRWVLEQACLQSVAWAKAGKEIGVSVNVSAFQLVREDFAADVERVLTESGLDPALLMLEITETTMMRDLTAACTHLELIKRLGVSVAIDDFGTGYASLSHLQRMPADVLKVDRSFVSALAEGDRSRDLLRAIVGVGRSLSLKVLAEGLETEEQLRAVSELGCEMGQGFLLGRPTPAEVIAGLPAPRRAASALHTQAR